MLCLLGYDVDRVGLFEEWLVAGCCVEGLLCEGFAPRVIATTTTTVVCEILASKQATHLSLQIISACILKMNINPCDGQPESTIIVVTLKSESDQLKLPKSQL